MPKKIEYGEYTVYYRNTCVGETYIAHLCLDTISSEVAAQTIKARLDYEGIGCEEILYVQSPLRGRGAAQTEVESEKKNYVVYFRWSGGVGESYYHHKCVMAESAEHAMQMVNSMEPGEIEILAAQEADENDEAVG